MTHARIALLLLTTSLFAGAFAQEPAKLQPRAENRVVVDGSTTVGPIAKAFLEHFKTVNPGVEVTVSESGSGIGAKSLINGTCDVADMSRFMSDAEFKAAVEKGVLPVAHIIAFDGIAVVVHPSNPVGDLSLEQLRDIYTGKTTNWKQIGGPDLKIVKISRETNSGTYQTFEELVLKEQKVAQDAEYVGSNGAAQQRVKSTPGALAYVGLGFVEAGVKPLQVQGVRAERGTVVLGKYPISRPLFMFTNGYPKLGSPLHAYVTLYLSAKGQEIVQSLGYVPVTSYPEEETARK